MGGVAQYWNQRFGSDPEPPVAWVVSFCVNGDCSTQIANQTILGPAFFNPAILDPLGLERENGNVRRYQSDMLIHEYMHILNKANDEELAEKWGLGNKGYDTTDPSNAISDFIANDCRNK
jgi:hypothetical protein